MDPYMFSHLPLGRALIVASVVLVAIGATAGCLVMRLIHAVT